MCDAQQGEINRLLNKIRIMQVELDNYRDLPLGKIARDARRQAAIEAEEIAYDRRNRLDTGEIAKAIRDHFNLGEL